MALCAACVHKETSSTPAETASNEEKAQTPVAKQAEEQGPSSAQAVMKPAKNQKSKGIVHFTQSGDKIKIEAMLEGLKPGPHGFHIHETGDCSSVDFKSAGGHFNPSHKSHGAADGAERHGGDLGNIVADSKGKAKLTVEAASLSMSGAQSIIGRAIVLHAGPDDLKSQPAGNSGDRIACGVIEALK